MGRAPGCRVFAAIPSHYHVATDSPSVHADQGLGANLELFTEKLLHASILLSWAQLDSRESRPYATSCESPIQSASMKRGAKKMLLTSFLIAAALFLHAEPVAQLKPTDYVSDFAQVIDQNTVVQLDDICKQIDDKAHAQIAVVTINSLDGSDIESYAVDLFKKWGVGGKSSNRGVLILLAVKDRKYRFEVGYGLEPILPDGKTGGFGREAVPSLKASDYSSAVLLMTSRVADVIAQDAGIQLTGNQPREPVESQPQFQTGLTLGKIIIAIIILLLVLFTPLRSVLFWMLLSGGRGGFGGGGFGGGGGGFGGGGGGFGGFGGGSSGGGGASGSW